MYEYAMSRAAHIIIHNNLTLFLNVKDGTHARAYRASARRARRNGAHPGEVRQAQGARLHLSLTDPDRRSLTIILVIISDKSSLSTSGARQSKRAALTLFIRLCTQARAHRLEQAKRAQLEQLERERAQALGRARAQQTSKDAASHK